MANHFREDIPRKRTRAEAERLEKQPTQEFPVQNDIDASDPFAGAEPVGAIKPGESFEDLSPEALMAQESMQEPQRVESQDAFEEPRQAASQPFVEAAPVHGAGMPAITMRDVTKIYPAQPNKPALEGINLDIYSGEFVFLVGHSGSGKSTLLKTLNREVVPSSGTVIVAGQDLMKISNRKIPMLRRQVGCVFQDFKLLPKKTAYENVAFALECIGKSRGIINVQVPEVLRLVGLEEKMHMLPDQLSGGEQQRVSVARAMVNRPPILICDEPTGNLDPAISLGIMKLLERINRMGTTVIVATHDREMVDSMRRRVVALEGGRVIRDQEQGGYGYYGAI